MTARARSVRRIVQRIVSGGQTGVDRAALDVALALDIPCGGWCPRGRKAEDGPIDTRYPLSETASDRYPERTRRNVREADATLILVWGDPVGGTKLTADIAARSRRPWLVLDLAAETRDALLAAARAWLAEAQPETLNIAGPRESNRPGAYADAYDLLTELLEG